MLLTRLLLTLPELPAFAAAGPGIEAETLTVRSHSGVAKRAAQVGAVATQYVESSRIFSCNQSAQASAIVERQFDLDPTHLQRVQSDREFFVASRSASRNFDTHLVPELRVLCGDHFDMRLRHGRCGWSGKIANDRGAGLACASLHYLLGERCVRSRSSERFRWLVFHRRRERRCGAMTCCWLVTRVSNVDGIICWRAKRI